MARKIGCIIIAALLCVHMNACSGDSEKEGAAYAAAQAWLSIVDNEDYMESWEQAADLFKKAVPSGQWERTIASVRQPLGKMLSRTVIDKSYRTSLPGAPDGEYVIFQFNTSFENKKKAVETVTPMLGDDGIWRVSGYYIK